MSDLGMDRLKFLVFGAGALGTLVGGSLANAGYPVVFLERPEPLVQLKKRGLHLQIHNDDIFIPHPQVADTLADAFGMMSFDVAIFAVKAYDTQVVIRSFIPFRDRLPVFLCLQNGVENELALELALGSESVIPGMVTHEVKRQRVGDIVVQNVRGMGIGARHPLSERLLHALEEVKLNPQSYQDTNSMKWSKMMTNLINNATSAILRMTPAAIFEHPGLASLELAQLREALNIMNAMGYHALDLPGLPINKLEGLVRFPDRISIPLIKRMLGNRRGNNMPSFYLDLMSGKKVSEVEYLNGAVVRYGVRLGIPTPVNKVLTQTLMALVNGEYRPEVFDHHPERLIELLGGHVGGYQQ
ncbi:MAG: ketopantoate reductase family protein [Anaerolineaceae bacterium]|nr:ketopantoate reductase family protein [Anaerolineaceae bacterium]